MEKYIRVRGKEMSHTSNLIGHKKVNCNIVYVNRNSTDRFVVGLVNYRYIILYT